MMNRNKLGRYLSLFLLFATFQSCVDNLNFDQIEYSATPVFNGPIIFFDLNQNNFIDPNTNSEINTVIDEADFTYLDASVVRDNLERVELSFEINNQFDRNFSLSIQFLDENNIPTHPVITFDANPNELLVPPVETIVIANNQAFLRTKKVLIRIELSPGATPLSPNIIQNLSFKSSGTFYVRT